MRSKSSEYKKKESFVDRSLVNFIAPEPVESTSRLLATVHALMSIADFRAFMSLLPASFTSDCLLGHLQNLVEKMWSLEYGCLRPGALLNFAKEKGEVLFPEHPAALVD
jgi:hypothetical protein